MKFTVAAVLMGIVLTLLVVVALNMDPVPKAKKLTVDEIPKPELSNMGGVQAEQNDFAPEVYKPTPFPSIQPDAILPVSEITDQVGDNETVLGITLNGESRAYPLAMLSGKNLAVVNDTVGDVPIAVTWDESCSSATIYGRQLKLDGGDKGGLTLQSSGMTWKKNVVLRDSGTESLWCQITGKCKQGGLSGQELRRMPSQVSTWKSWKTQFPESTVMINEAKNRIPDNPFAKADKIIVGVCVYTKQKSYSLDSFNRNPVINDQVGAKQFALVYDKESGSVRAFSTTLDKESYHFRLENGQLWDERTDSKWDPISGRCLSGTDKGKLLVPLAISVATGESWKQFYPESKTWSPSDAQPEN